jgi:HSP20 family protein
MTLGPDGKPQVREFGNIKPGTRLGKPSIDFREGREPLIDIITSETEVKVIVELPGVEKKDINLHSTENMLTVSVDVPERKYYKEIELLIRVNPKQAKASYKNGVLEVIFQKEKKEKPKGERIDL